MRGHKLVISPAALDDLRDIFHFGLRNWGQSRATRYLDTLKEQLWRLAEQPLIGLERPELFPEIRSFPVESHIVFYQVQSKQVEIIRVLHGRQNPNRHIR